MTDLSAPEKTSSTPAELVRGVGGPVARRTSEPPPDDADLGSRGPRISDGGRSRIMRAIRPKNTKPEILVRQGLHALGYRFRLHRRDLPGTPDIVLPRLRIAIQVHGCFWHQHSTCRAGRLPATRQGYWSSKLARNVERDRENEKALNALGWTVLTIWECETRDRNGLIQRLREDIDQFQHSPRRD